MAWTETFEIPEIFMTSAAKAVCPRAEATPRHRETFAAAFTASQGISRASAK